MQEQQTYPIIAEIIISILPLIITLVYYITWTILRANARNYWGSPEEPKEISEENKSKGKAL